jgi:hypothetical protein
MAYFFVDYLSEETEVAFQKKWESAWKMLSALKAAAQAEPTAGKACEACQSVIAVGHFKKVERVVKPGCKRKHDGPRTRVRCLGCVGKTDPSTSEESNPWTLARLGDDSVILSLEKALKVLKAAGAPWHLHDYYDGLKGLGLFHPRILSMHQKKLAENLKVLDRNPNLPLVEVDDIKALLGTVSEEILLAQLSENNQNTIRTASQYVDLALTPNVYFACNYVQDRAKQEHLLLDQLFRSVYVYKAACWWPDELVSGTSLGLNTLWLLGGLNTMTRLHVDRTEAWNVAFAISGHSRQPEAPLAYWLFVAPAVVGAWLDPYLKQGQELPSGKVYSAGVGITESGTGKSDILLTHQDMLRIQADYNLARMGRPDLPESGVLVMEQRHGQIMFVPPGWAHAVVNVQPCIKVARDLYNSMHFPLYAIVARSSLRYLFSEDYMNLPTVALHYLRNRPTPQGKAVWWH